MWDGWEQNPTAARFAHVGFWTAGCSLLTAPYVIHGQAVSCIACMVRCNTHLVGHLPCKPRRVAALAYHCLNIDFDRKTGGDQWVRLLVALCSCASGHPGPGALDLGRGTLGLLFSPLRLSGVLWTGLATLGMFARERGIQNSQGIAGLPHGLKKGTAVLASNNLGQRRTRWGSDRVWREFISPTRRRPLLAVV
ncbi:uncharacterized protein B0H64DRAFT_91011 [Chaetomium fimeti]|uniref:Uncharacterized protein n=1 Tax=Chaetomium fimeti TaxID=1854472 RepID=A0AAE0HMT2_9PEZI|nr:hypothetical protein B0H64DRAFT_91011 [Chaetomium fimeti]